MWIEMIFDKLISEVKYCYVILFCYYIREKKINIYLKMIVRGSDVCFILVNVLFFNLSVFN